MDVRALGETLLAIAITPVVSAGMVLVVVGGIVLAAKKIYRR